MHEGGGGEGGKLRGRGLKEEATHKREVPAYNWARTESLGLAVRSFIPVTEGRVVGPVGRIVMNSLDKDITRRRVSHKPCCPYLPVYTDVDRASMTPILHSDGRK